MAPRVSISLKTARKALDNLDPRGPESVEIQRAISAAERKRSTLSKLRKPKKEKRQKRSEETSILRDAVWARCNGFCEHCDRPFTDADPAEMDHFWGRGKAPQSLQNTWMLHSTCHRAKTRNFPSAVEWVGWFASHCHRYDYSAEESKARTRAAFVESRAALGSGRHG